MFNTVTITGEALARVCGLPHTFNNSLTVHECTLISKDPIWRVQIPSNLSHVKSGDDLIKYFGLM